MSTKDLTAFGRGVGIRPKTSARSAANVTKKVVTGFLYVIGIIFLLLVFLVPVYWMVLTAVESANQVVQNPPLFWVSAPQWDNFVKAFESIDFWHYTKNSLIVTFSVMILQFITVIPAAYAFARYRFKGKKILFSITLLTMMLPAQLTFLPVYLMFARLKLINNIMTLILPFGASGFGIFMLRQSFMQIPEEILEAARLDKASEFTIIRRIMLPMALPTIAMLALFTFITTWNDYFWPLVMTTTNEVQTLPVGITGLQNIEVGITQHYVMAGNILMILPVVIVFLIAQKQIIKAFTYTGEK